MTTARWLPPSGARFGPPKCILDAPWVCARCRGAMPLEAAIRDNQKYNNINMI
jgi:hypothetical protein